MKKGEGVQSLGLWGDVDESEPTGFGGLLTVPPGAPLALRMTPRSLDEFVGQEALLGSGKPLRSAIEGDSLPSMLFWGPPGTGKTALARLIAAKTKSVFRELSAVASGVQDVRAVVSEASSAQRRGKRTILFLDEIHRFNKAQQDVLLPHVERGTIVLLGATTENPYFCVNSALLSRTRVFAFKHLSSHQVLDILSKAVGDCERGLGSVGPVELEDGVLEHIARFSGGDARIALNVLEALHGIADQGEKGALLSLDKALGITQSPQLLYDRQGDQHYEVASAFIKSMRGSDPDATVYWLARMLEAGEDPRFVARRIVIAASEDVGLADPMALVVAESAFQAAGHLGMPEARLALAQAALYVALAPKSNSVLLAVESAATLVREEPPYPVPPHLRGTGSGYKYTHDYPGHWTEQEYLPREIQGRRLYKKGTNDPPSRGRP